ncbi:MAG TPA: large conductance mechanosensitive channel protein MscL [Anaerolineales bacterium]
MLREFKAFVMRGNLLELAVAFILGVAFGRVVTSLVNDVIMPPIGLALGGVDFSNLFINLSKTRYPTLAEAQAAGAPTLNYGLFILTVLDFVIVALVVFVLVRAVNRMQRPKPVAPTTKECPYCLSIIPLKATRCPNCTSELSAA